MENLKNMDLKIIAGPCSLNKNSPAEIERLARIEIEGQRVIFGTRTVGLKSRTELNQTGEGMGMDFDALMHNLQLLQETGSTSGFDMLPSLEMAAKIVADTNLLVASEIMIAGVQMPLMAQMIPKGKAMPWNPSVDQLGWHVTEIAQHAAPMDWDVGLKNGKWLGENLDIAENPAFQATTGVEKAWRGLQTYLVGAEAIFIQRGVDVPQKGDFRNLPLHQMAIRTKQATGRPVYFDPSHTFGPKMRDRIVEGTIVAMQFLMPDSLEFVYDGILIEVGTSETDTGQHITIDELEEMARGLTCFRNPLPPAEINT